jgi:hypothetical protein
MKQKSGNLLAFSEHAKALDENGQWANTILDGKLMTEGKQLLHFVFGGELKDLSGSEFRDLSKLDVVGFFPDYASAVQAWKAKAQSTVDNAHMRYFVTHMHRLIDPSKDKT